jgi:DNA primase
MSDTTQLIKDKIDAADFIKDYVKLHPAGKNLKGLCPFHKEKTPSFMVSPDRGIWHCFGCGEGGDVIKFLMKYENLDFYDALKVLAEKAGIELKTIVNRDFHAHNNLYKALEAAKNFFKSQLESAPPVKNYLLERGLKDETVREFEIGLAPAGSDVLMRHLVKAGFSIQDLEKAGLVLKTERGTYRDRFRARIMFPIHNHFGKVVGFTGRVLPGQESENVGKYVNSPETPIFQKSKILYGFYKTKNDIRQANAAVLVEGQMDFLMAWQDGVKNIAATSGTSLTQDHLAVLRKISENLVISFDADSAGAAASERVLDLAGAADFNTRVMLLNGYKDPADLVKDNPGKLSELAASALPAIQYYFYKYLNSLKGNQIAEKKRGIRAVLAKISVLGSAVERAHWLKELSALTGIEESVLAEEMSNLKVSAPGIEETFASDSSIADDLSRKDLIAQRILALVFNHQSFRSAMEPYLTYFPLVYQSVSAKLFNSMDLKEPAGDAGDLIGLIQLRSSFNAEYSDERKAEAEFKELLRQLKIEHLKEKRQKIRLALASVKNEAEELKLLEEHRLVDQELQKL